MMRESGPMVTSPTSVALGAIQAEGWIFGALLRWVMSIVLLSCFGLAFSDEPKLCQQMLAINRVPLR